MNPQSVVTCMDSKTVGDSGDNSNQGLSRRSSGRCIVYTRRSHKKTQKSGEDTVTTSASTAPSPAAAGAAENPTTTPAPAKVSTAAVASASATEVSPASSSKDHNDSAVVSPTSAAARGDAATTGKSSVEEALEAREANGGESLPHGKSPSHNSVVTKGPNALAVSEDNCLTHHQGHGSSQGDEMQNPERSSLSHLDVSKNLENLSDLHGQDGKILQTSGNELQIDGGLTAVPSHVPGDNGLGTDDGICKPLEIFTFDDRIRFKLAKATSRDEITTLRKKLECELDQVRRVGKQLEDKELQLAPYNQIRVSNLSYSSNYLGRECGVGGYGYPQLQDARIDVARHQEFRTKGLSRVISDVGAPRNLETRPYSRQLSVAVMENSYGDGLFAEKEKRVPKANSYYRNSEFLLGKDRLPPESNKRQKTNNGRKRRGDMGHTFHFANGFDKSSKQAFKSCSKLLQRLMEHKHGWVFNEPVNAKALGLVDYHDIIKHPMDLGTIKTRLSQNWYKSPGEFAEDVRLVFRNAMTYNPKGQDVHAMAEQLSQIFEERWVTIDHLWNYRMYQDAELVTPNSRKAAPLSNFSLASSRNSIPAQAPISVYQVRTLGRQESMAAEPRVQWPPAGRPPVPKKPKAKDPNKRDMTYDEKQRLGTNLQELAAIKLDSIIQIIKKRNTALSQNDEEIEVDIDNVDVETLWELDRFVANYKKGLSKSKRKAEIAHQARLAANRRVAPSVRTSRPSLFIVANCIDFSVSFKTSCIKWSHYCRT